MLKSCIFASGMAENLFFPADADRTERYRLILQYLPDLLDPKAGRTANAANTAAVLMQALRFHWIGFYFVSRVDGHDELVLGPFQGPVACTRIAFGKGVCGTAWKLRESIYVPDVNQFPGHIACSAMSKSELVVPVVKDGEVIGVLDIDSSELADFSDEDRTMLEETVRIVAPCL